MAGFSSLFAGENQRKKIRRPGALHAHLQNLSRTFSCLFAGALPTWMVMYKCINCQCWRGYVFRIDLPAMHLNSHKSLHTCTCVYSSSCLKLYIPLERWSVYMNNYTIVLWLTLSGISSIPHFQIFNYPYLLQANLELLNSVILFCVLFWPKLWKWKLPNFLLV